MSSSASFWRSMPSLWGSTLPVLVLLACVVHDFWLPFMSSFWRVSLYLVCGPWATVNFIRAVRTFFVKNEGDGG